MRAGDMSSEIKIQKSAGKDSAGQPLNGWVDVDAVWADVRFLNGVQAIKAGATTSKVSASMRIWWRTDISSAMRVLYDGKPYQIASVLPDPRRVFIDLVCEATT